MENFAEITKIFWSLPKDQQCDFVLKNYDDFPKFLEVNGFEFSPENVVTMFAYITSQSSIFLTGFDEDTVMKTAKNHLRQLETNFRTENILRTIQRETVKVFYYS